MFNINNIDILLHEHCNLHFSNNLKVQKYTVFSDMQVIEPLKHGGLFIRVRHVTVNTDVTMNNFCSVNRRCAAKTFECDLPVYRSLKANLLRRPTQRYSL